MMTRVVYVNDTNFVSFVTYRMKRKSEIEMGTREISVGWAGRTSIEAKTGQPQVALLMPM